MEPEIYLADVASELAPDAQILAHASGYVSITLGDKSAEFNLGRAQYDDFADSLTRHEGSPYCENLKRDLRIKLACVLLETDISPDLELSTLLTTGGDDWPDGREVDVEIANPLAHTLASGLEALYEGLTTLVAGSPVDVPAIEEDAANIHYLIKYYEESGSLSSKQASKGSLAYIKAAAICAVHRLEKQRSGTQVLRIKSALNKKIATLLDLLVDVPYAQIAAPECVKEYLQLEQLQTAAQATPVPRLESILPAGADKLEDQLRRLGPSFLRRRQGAWNAFRSDNPDRLSQSANSMVELLDGVIGHLCENTSLSDFLAARFGRKDESQWVVATRKWISETKSNLHRVKHHDDYSSQQVVESLMKSAESIMELLLGTE